MAQTIEMVVSPTGETKITVSGVKGSSCKALTKGLENLLGPVLSRQETADMYEQEELKIEATNQ